MPEPLTTGALVAAALTAAAQVIGKDVIGQAAKNTYIALKSRLAAFAARDAEKLEENPTEARAAVLVEEVDARPETDKADLRTLAEMLIETLKEDGQGDKVATTLNQFNNYGGQQFNAPGGTQNFGTFPSKPEE